MVMCCTAASEPRPAKLNLAHVAHVKQADAGAHGHVLGDQATARAWVLDRHVPAAKVDHLRFQGAMGGVEGGLLEGGCGRCCGGRHISLSTTLLYPANDRHRAAAGQTRGAIGGKKAGN